ncbi:hypothetical protein GCM10017576_05610 [Microbacterium barkeri]|uniref:Uncharacterized protein n=1 Tax=Microbacterium barkeri TaxID=33917 RepID=A0A9W6LVL0_9MICO|nr:hypothetical protein GCM10017576_05610 [Microbacterium barkeri]
MGRFQNCQFTTPKAYVLLPCPAAILASTRRGAAGAKVETAPTTARGTAPVAEKGVDASSGAAPSGIRRPARRDRHTTP